MLLKNKVAVIYGAGGAVGSAVATAFAKQGARVFLSGRTIAKVEIVAQVLKANGDVAEVAEVDALDEASIEKYLDNVAGRAGGIDISFNAIGVPASVVAERGMQGVPLTEIPLESFMQPISTYTRSHFLTGRAAARRMMQAERSGVILMHTPEPARAGFPLLGGMGPAWSAIEALCRSFSAEFASHGVRSACLRTTGLPETQTIQIIFGTHAKILGITPNDFRQMMESAAHTRRSTTLEELTGAAVMLASDLAAGMTGTVANLTAGKVSD